MNHSNCLIKSNSLTSGISILKVYQYLAEVRGCCSVIAVTRAEQGSVLLSGDQRWDIGIFELGELVDTTGAGDLYAGGFLHGYTQGEPLERCGQLGALCAGSIVTQLGARSQVSLPELMKQHLN